MQADANTLVMNIEQRIEWYQHKHDKNLSVSATAQMLSTMLYMKRFFPYSVWNILGGLDDQGIYFSFGILLYLGNIWKLLLINCYKRCWCRILV